MSPASPLNPAAVTVGAPSSTISSRRKGPSNLLIHDYTFSTEHLSPHSPGATSPKTPPLCFCGKEDLGCLCARKPMNSHRLSLKQYIERKEGHLSPNRLSTPTSAHASSHHFCTCLDKSPPGDDNLSSFDQISPRTPQRAEHFRFSPKHDGSGSYRRSSSNSAGGSSGEKTTRSIGTSPQKELKTSSVSDSTRNILLSPVKLETNTGSSPSSRLEKASSVDEKKPQRNLRTTRSLSPRPPVRHQHAITVSDENDVTQVKLSPNDELDDVFNHHKRQSRNKQRDVRSPSLTETYIGVKRDRGLVYVPSDPWLLMKDLQDTKKYSPKKRRFFDAKSIDDPWELRDDRKRLQRQAKSLTSKTDELSSHIMSLPDPAINSRKGQLQRSKSPAFHDESIISRQQLHKYKSASNLIKTDSVTNKSLTSILGPESSSGPRSLTIESPEQKKLMSLSPTLGYHTLSDFDMNKKSKNGRNLTLDTYHLQPRHSFSTSTAIRKGTDELPLNIRRLSEQMRETYQQNGMISPPKSLPTVQAVPAVKGEADKSRDSTQKKLSHVESLLETRC